MTTKASPAGTQFENRVRGGLKRIGFRDVEGGKDFIVGGFQVDAVGGWDDVLLVIEATQTSRTNASIRDRIVEVRGKSGDLRKGFRNLEAYRGYTRFEFALVTQGFEFSKTDEALADSEPKIHLIDNQVFEYYQELARTIGELPSLFNFLGELGVVPQDRSVHRTPAFKVEVEKHLTGYLFFCEPQKLLEVAYVARRETGRKHYYQRMLTKSRLQSIRRFIDDGGVFPNNVILAFDDRPQFKSHPMPQSGAPAWLEWGELTFPKSYRAAWIIDGQHRLYAFGQGQSNAGLQKLPVFAFEQMQESKQAKFFIEINREQKPVSVDLIWDLEAELRPESMRGLVALTAKDLNELEPLTDRIYFPLSGTHSTGRLKISSICNDINEIRLLEDKTKNMTQSQSNPLTSGVDHKVRSSRVAGCIADFLTSILSLQESDSYRDAVILRPGGITLVLHVYEQVLIRLDQRPRQSQLKEYAQAFILALEYVSGGPDAGAVKSFVRNRLTSYAQRREVITTVVNEMRDLLDDENFGKQGIDSETPLTKRVISMERKLAKAVAEICEIHTIKDLKQRAPEAVWRDVERRARNEPDEPLHALLTLGQIKEMVVRNDNRGHVIQRLTDSNDGFSNEQEALVALSGLIGLRNPLGHGRSTQNRRLGEAYLMTFERILG